MKHTFIFFIIVFIITNIFAQEDCENTFKGQKFPIKICNDQGWKIDEDSKGILIRAEKESCFIGITDSEGDKKPEEIWQKRFETIKRVNSGCEIIKQEKILVDTVNAWFGIMYQPEMKWESQTVMEESYKISIFFIFEKKEYHISCNYKGEDYTYSEKLVREIASKIEFLMEDEMPLTNHETELIKVFESKLLSALQKSDIEEFKKLMITQEGSIEAFELYIQDEELKERFIRVAKFKWGNFTNERILPSEENFKKVIMKGKELGLVWPEIEFIELTYKVRQDEDNSGIKSIIGMFSFSYKNAQYSIGPILLTLYVDGWYISFFNDVFIY
jgi:hypothetical protein